MGRPAELTKKYLEEHGVYFITPEGQVFLQIPTMPEGYTHEATYTKHIKESRFDTQEYMTFSVYDSDLYLAGKAKGHINRGMRSIVRSRAVYAWYNNIAPEGMDVDHINNDSLDDRLDNLQLLTRAENLAKRKGNINQYGKRLSERE